MTQGTIGTPVGPGSAGTYPDVVSLPATWLSLYRYSRILAFVGWPHFFGSYSSTVFPISGNCDVVVPRHGWQKPEVASREEIKNEIFLAEKELSEYMGFNLAPGFVVGDAHPYPKPYETLAVGSYGVGVNNLEISVRLKSGGVLEPGVRQLTSIGTATTSGSSLQYLDLDGDGTIDSARITVPTTQTDLCKMKAYVSGTDGAQEWEIRHPRRKYISGSNLVMEFDIWLLLNPELDGAYPGVDTYRALDYTDTSNLQTTVDIYYESVDNTAASVTFFWERAAGGNLSALTSQEGVFVVRDVASGEVIPRAATYSSSTGVWSAAAWVVGRDPEQVSFNYYAGHQSREFKNGTSCDPLSEQYAKAIAYLATARLPRPVCACQGVTQWVDRLMTDMSKVTPDSSFNVTPRDLENPFGTRLGEIMAWRLVGKVDQDQRQVEAVVI